MKTLYFDCFAGASGNMILGALVALGVDEIELIEQIELLNITDFEIEFTTKDKSGISAIHADVKVPHEHAHRHLHTIEKIINDSLLKDWNEESAAVKFLQETVKFRNLLRRLAENIADGKEISGETLKAINAQLKKQSGFTVIEKGENGFEKRFRFDLSEPAKLLQPIAESAADFLCYGNFEFLRKCESSACVLFFYDTTKNHKRRWCSMKACGNQAKAAAFYKRKKASCSESKLNFKQKSKELLAAD